MGKVTLYINDMFKGFLIGWFKQATFLHNGLIRQVWGFKFVVILSSQDLQNILRYNKTEYDLGIIFSGALLKKYNRPKPITRNQITMIHSENQGYLHIQQC